MGRAVTREPLPLDFSVLPLSWQGYRWDILRDGVSALDLKVVAVDLDRGLVQVLDVPVRYDEETQSWATHYIDGRFELRHLPTGTLCTTNAAALTLAEGAG